MRFSPELATEVGLLESLILLQYEFWSATEGIPVGDEIAVHDSCRALQKAFPFKGGSTVDAAFDSLVSQGLLRWETAPGGRNDGRYVFICFAAARSLNSIVVANRPLPIPRQDEEEVSHFRTPESQKPENGEEVSNIQTPALVSSSGTPESRTGTLESESWTPASRRRTPRVGAYKERVRALESNENKESVGEYRARDFQAGQGEHDPTQPAQSKESLKRDALVALFHEPDTQVLLAVFGFNTTRPDTLSEKDWEVLPSAVAFMRNEKIEGGELRAFSQIANMRWTGGAYLSQLETHFYKLMPARARAKARQLEAANAPKPPAVSNPVPPPQSADALDPKQEKRRRTMRACANVFLHLPETEQAARREVAVKELSGMLTDRYNRNLNHNISQQNTEQWWSIRRAWEENLMRGVWAELRRDCEVQLGHLTDEESMDLDPTELGLIPVPVLDSPDGESQPAEPPTTTVEAPQPPAEQIPASWNVGQAMTGIGDIAGGLLKNFRPQREPGN